MPTDNLSASVGKGGVNLRPDVQLVQQLLVRAGLAPGPVDGICGPRTEAAILQFQKRFLTAPDARVDPGGVTWRKLSLQTLPASNKPYGGPHNPVHGAAKTPPASVTAPASGDWSGDSAKWTQEKKLLSLEAGFREKVSQVIAKLTTGGFQPKIVYGWRSVAVQKHLHDLGRTKVLFSFHNAQKPDGTPNAYAADIIDQRWAWSDDAEANGFWDALGKAAKDVGLHWGGDWKSFPDVAHVQKFPNSDLKRVKRESGLES